MNVLPTVNSVMKEVSKFPKREVIELTDDDLKRIWLDSYIAVFALCMEYLQNSRQFEDWSDASVRSAVECACSVANRAMKVFKAKHESKLNGDLNRDMNGYERAS